MKIKNITFIGSGNVATHLSISLQDKGINIVEIWSKTTKSAVLLSEKLKCNYITDLNNLSSTDLLIVSVKDDVISEVISKIKDKNINIVHTSGSVDLDVLEDFSNYGVFYPLQSFNKEVEVDFSITPICIESKTSEFSDSLKELASKISDSINFINSEQRKQLHIAAVFACNFTNHILSISESILKKSDLDFNLLKPLIEHTFNKIKDSSPSEVQTGPAKREDYNTIEKHLNLLEGKSDLKIIYSKITNHIINNNLDE